MYATVVSIWNKAVEQLRAKKVLRYVVMVKGNQNEYPVSKWHTLIALCKPLSYYLKLSMVDFVRATVKIGTFYEWCVAE